MTYKPDIVQQILELPKHKIEDDKRYNYDCLGVAVLFANLTDDIDWSNSPAGSYLAMTNEINPGSNLPYNMAGMWDIVATSNPVSEKQLKPGDILVYQDSQRNGDHGHVETVIDREQNNLVILTGDTNGAPRLKYKTIEEQKEKGYQFRRWKKKS